MMRREIEVVKSKKTKIGAVLFGVAALFGGMSSASAALVLNAAQPITEIVTVQPIIVSDTDGSNTANFFGNASQQAAIEGYIDSIWAQAGIDVNFLSANTWNNTYTNWGAGGPPDNGGATRPTSDLGKMVADGAAAGVASTDPNVINMYFVNIAAGFSLLSANSAAGLAFVGGNGVSQYVGGNLLTWAGGQEVIASVVAHEIGHNLGLGHITEVENLMQSAGSYGQGERLNASQIATALASNLSVAVTPVPVPPAALLFLSSLGAFSWLSRRRKTVEPVSEEAVAA